LAGALGKLDVNFCLLIHLGSGRPLELYTAHQEKEEEQEKDQERRPREAICKVTRAIRWACGVFYLKSFYKADGVPKVQNSVVTKELTGALGCIS
jgi:hypothetical protein